MPNSSSHFVHVNGIRLHYREWGAATSPDLVLVHGWATSSVLWHDVAVALSDDYHIIAPDNRGNGESDVPEQGYHISRYAADVVELIEALGLVRPAYAGNSWGANIGTYLTAEHPELISRAVLEDPVFWKMVDAFVTVVPWVTERRERPEQVRAEALGQGLSVEQADRAVYVATHFSPHALVQVSSLNRDWALKCDDYLARIAVPTLVLVADPTAGGYISTEELDHHRTAASNNVQFRLWEGTGHLMHTEQPERFVREVKAFLDAT